MSVVAALLVPAWSRRRLRRDDAVVIDTETTDLYGHVIQVSVIDLHGRALMNELIRPSAPVSQAAYAVHGIADADLVDAPPLAAVAGRLLEVTAGKQLLAYNAAYDRAVLTRDLAAAGVRPGHLGQPWRWRCLMRARMLRHDAPRARLGGPHDALGDCRAALQLLNDLSTGASTGA